MLIHFTCIRTYDMYLRMLELEMNVRLLDTFPNILKQAL